MNIRPLRWASIANSAQLLFVAATTAVNCSNETTSPIHALLRLLCGYNGNAFSACSFATTFLFWSGDYAECMNGGVSLFAAALAAGAFAAAMLRSVSVAFSHWQLYAVVAYVVSQVRVLRTASISPAPYAHLKRQFWPIYLPIAMFLLICGTIEMHKRGWILLLVGEMAAAATGIGAIHQKAPEVARILGLEREAVNDAERRDQKMKSLLSPMNAHKKKQRTDRPAEESVRRLMLLGFNREESIIALQMTGNDVEKASNLLLDESLQSNTQ